MKKRFTFLIAALMLLTMITLPEMVKGQTTTTFVAGSNYTANMTLPCEAGGFSWVTSAAPSSFESASPSRGYQYSKVSTNLTTTIENATITKVEVVASTNGNANLNSISVYVGNIQIGETQNMPKENNKTYTFQDTGKSGEIKVTMTNSGGTNNKSTYVKSITVTYTTGGGPTTYTVTYNANNGENPVPTYADGGHDAGDYTVLPNTNSHLGFTKTGHTFITWTETLDPTSTAHAPGTQISIPDITTLYAQWTPNTHTVTLPNTNQYGSYSLSYTYNSTTVTSPSAVPYGVQVTLNYTPATGYEYYEATWTVGGIAIEGNKFTMPDTDVTVGASVAEATSWAYTHAAGDGAGSTTGTWVYTNTAANPSNFTVQQTKVGQTDIATVYSELRLYSGHYLEIFPATTFNKVMTSVEITCSTEGYATAIGNSTIIAGDNNEVNSGDISTSNSVVTIDLSDYTNCTYLKITATAKAFITVITVNYADPVVVTNYTISYADNLTNGAFAATGNPSQGIAGNNVTITTVPAQNYRLATMTYAYGETNAYATINGNAGTFEMPAANVTVSATFELMPAVTATFTDGVYSETLLSQASFDRWNTYSVTGDQVWGFASSYGAKMSGYENSTKYENEDWFISPTMAVANGKLSIAFECAAKSGQVGMVTLWYSKNYPGRGNPTSYSWTQLTPDQDLPYANENWNYQDATVTITDANMENIHFALKYISTTETAGTFEMKNFSAKQYYTITLSATNGTLTSSPATSAVVGAEVTLDPTPTSGYHFVSWTKTPSSLEINANNKFNMPAQNVSVSTVYEQDAVYTITFNENGVDVYEDDNIPAGLIGNNLPYTQFGSLPANLEFLGWSTSQIATYATSEPEIIDESYNVSGDVTFYAVYKYDYSYTIGGGTPTWTKVTDNSTLQPGDQLVIASDANDVVATKVITNTNNANYMSSVGEEGLFGEGIMNSLPTGAAVLTLGGEEDAWTLANSDNELLGATAEKKLAWGNGTTTWSISISSGNATIQNTHNYNPNYGRFLYNTGSPRFTTYTSNTSSSMLLPQLYRLEGGGTTVNGTYYLTTVDEISSPETIVSNATVNLSNNVTINSTTGSYTVNGNLNGAGYIIINEQSDRLVVNNGGQLSCDNAVTATMNKNIAAASNWSTESKGWNFIATPLTGVYTLTGTDMVSGTDYDLYRLNNTTWENYKNTDHSDFTALYNGTGYLYAKSAAQTISYTGTVNPFTTTSSANIKSLSEGWNLVGNPYTHDIYINRAYYKMKEDGSDVEPVTNYWENTIAPCTGVVIKATGDNETVTFSTSTPEHSTGNNSSLQMTLMKANMRGNAVQDRAVVSFNESMQLGKFIFNENNAKLFIPQNGEDYAIAFSDRQGDVPVHFRAKEVGTYTINFEGVDMDLNGVSLIDVYEGVEIDLGVEPSYTFIGSPADSEARFRIVFRTNGIDATSDIFAYQNGNEIIVSGEGELQVFDVMGRMVSTQYVNGVGTWRAASVQTGVYILRLNDKVQKIVVK